MHCGVLRQPATAADAGSGIAAAGFVSGVSVHYIRLARVIDGSPYYLYPGMVAAAAEPEKTPTRGSWSSPRS